MRERTFIRSWVMFTVVGVAMAALLNVIVDPYGIFGSPRIDGFNAKKPNIGTKVRTAKIHQVMKVRPRAIVVGNSRPEIGLDPAHPCWPAESRPAYNIAIPGMSVYGQIRYGQHAIAAGDVRLILLGLDFIDFLVPPDADHDPRAWPASHAKPMRLAVDAKGQPRSAFYWNQLQDQFSAALSLDALKDTVSTLIQQESGSVITRTTLGFNPGTPIFEPIIRFEGASLLFAQKNEEIAQRLLGRRWSLNHQGTNWSSNFEAVLRLLRQAKGEGIRAIPFINPLHADFLALIDKAGLWPLMEEWKRRVVMIAEKERADVVWDFSGFTDYAIESVEEVAARGESLRWFWEPSHYRKELGDRMLFAMLAESCADAESVDGLGVTLTSSNVEAHLATQRSMRDGFVSSNRHRIDKLADLIARIKRRQGMPLTRVSSSSSR
ncbi:MAG: hypothetical protein ACR2QF_10840 [Geminicoccaceae bacterium]